MIERHPTNIVRIHDIWDEPQPQIVKVSQWMLLVQAIQRISYNTVWYATIILGVVILACKTCLMLLS